MLNFACVRYLSTHTKRQSMRGNNNYRKRQALTRPPRRKSNVKIWTRYLINLIHAHFEYLSIQVEISTSNYTIMAVAMVSMAVAMVTSVIAMENYTEKSSCIIADQLISG